MKHEYDGPITAKIKGDPPPRRIPFLLRMPTIEALPPKG